LGDKESMEGKAGGEKNGKKKRPWLKKKPAEVGNGQKKKQLFYKKTAKESPPHEKS